MKKILEALTKVKSPPPILVSNYNTPHVVGFTPKEESIPYLEEDSELNKLVNPLIKGYGGFHLGSENGNLVWVINENAIIHNAYHPIANHLIDIWCKTNNKTEFSRTKLSKKLNKHSDNETEFRDLLLELYLDSKKHDLTIKNIRDFFAIKFEKAVENK